MNKIWSLLNADWTKRLITPTLLVIIPPAITYILKLVNGTIYEIRIWFIAPIFFLGYILAYLIHKPKRPKDIIPAKLLGFRGMKSADEEIIFEWDYYESYPDQKIALKDISYIHHCGCTLERRDRTYMGTETLYCHSCNREYDHSEYRLRFLITKEIRTRTGFNVEAN